MRLIFGVGRVYYDVLEKEFGKRDAPDALEILREEVQASLDANLDVFLSRVRERLNKDEVEY